MDTDKKCSNCKKVKNICEFYFKQTENRRHSWCKECLYEKQKLRWIDRKKKVVLLFGGKCSRCGYNKNYAALDFHHTDPCEKEFDWKRLRLRSWSSVIKELQKCHLLCKNCHAEVHNPNSIMTEPKTDNNYLNAKIEPTGSCPQCNSDVFGTTYCSIACSSSARRKVARPNRDELSKMIETMNLSQIGRKYKVSDNAVIKWVKNYGLI